MAFYDLSKAERNTLVLKMHTIIVEEVIAQQINTTLLYFADNDTYIRKNAYLIFGKIYTYDKALLANLIAILHVFVKDKNELVRQTAINAAGEIGKYNFSIVETFFHTALFDEHHRVRNAVIGSIKKMGEVNPLPVLDWARKYLHNTNKEIRREICHGIELRGRTHPQDILPLLKELQFDSTARVRNTLVHVLGQIAYKKGCLETVIEDLKNWTNKKLVKEAVAEIIDVHYRYRNFSFYAQEEARRYIEREIEHTLF